MGINLNTHGIGHNGRVSEFSNSPRKHYIGLNDIEGTVDEKVPVFKSVAQYFSTGNGNGLPAFTCR